MPDTLLDRLLRLPPLDPHVKAAPPLLLVAFTIVTARRLNGWKQSTLAELSSVSLSTVERIERGQPVSTDKLDKVGLGLGYAAGYFTAPRKPFTLAEAQQNFLDSYGDLAPVNLAQIETHDDARRLVRCEAIAFQSFAPDEKIPELTASLNELLDVGAFLSGPLAPSPKKGGRRRYYDIVLDTLRSMRRDGYWILAGIVEPGPDRHAPSVRTAVIVVSAKAGDPAGGNRRLLMADLTQHAELFPLAEAGHVYR